MKKSLLILVIICSTKIFPQDLFEQKNTGGVAKGDIVAEVDTIKITAEEFFYSYEFGPAFPKSKNNSKETHLKYIVNEKLLALAGYDNKTIEQDYANGLYLDIQADIATEELFRKEILPEVDITENEIEKIIQKKLIEYEIRWLYADEQNVVESYLQQIKSYNSFDTLFNKQINDSVFINDRELKSNIFDIYKKNPLFGQLLDTLKPGSISAPIHTDDGWYIIKVDNVWQNIITNETEQSKLRHESIEALTKSKMEYLSDQYVKGLFEKENPVIKRDAFNILRSILGKKIFSADKYSEWELDSKLDVALSNLGLVRGEKYPGISLVKGTNHNLLLDEFIIWYRNREQYVKLIKTDLITFSKSLENLVWLMVRDKLLTITAYEKGYDKYDAVVKQSGWWKDKITYSAYRNDLANSITLKSEELSLLEVNKKPQSEIKNTKLNEVLLRKILELKQKHKVKINQDVLSKIRVSSENNKNAVDIYLVKKGSLIPRPLYPTIDNEWAGWE